MIKEQRCQTVMEVFSKYKDLELKEGKKGSYLVFHMYMTRQMKETGIDALELSMRATNSMKRLGFHTVGDLAYAISGGLDLKTVRNCGRKTAREIMEHLFLFQYYQFSPEEQDDYIYEIVVRNCYSKVK